jgi:hypothetical protein
MLFFCKARLIIFAAFVFPLRFVPSYKQLNIFIYIQKIEHLMNKREVLGIV